MSEAIKLYFSVLNTIIGILFISIYYSSLLYFNYNFYNLSDILINCIY